MRNESCLDLKISQLLKRNKWMVLQVLIIKLPPLLALIGKFIRGAEETDLISCSLS